MELEIIAGSIEDALAAERGGATRIELCVDLDQDGLTPPLPLVQEVAAAVRIPVRVMLRRRNDFALHDEADLRALRDTAAAIQHAGAAGLVLGFIADQRVNEIALQFISAAAPRMKITFHRAFDALADQGAAIATLKRSAQVDGILTAGGDGHWQQRAERLMQLQAIASPEIEVLVGGGVDADAIEWLCRRTSLRAFHAGRAARENYAVNGRVLEQNVCVLSDAIYKRREKKDS
jgi:copper homeostasis protein